MSPVCRDCPNVFWLTFTTGCLLRLAGSVSLFCIVSQGRGGWCSIGGEGRFMQQGRRSVVVVAGQNVSWEDGRFLRMMFCGKVGEYQWSGESLPKRRKCGGCMDWLLKMGWGCCQKLHKRAKSARGHILFFTSFTFNITIRRRGCREALGRRVCRWGVYVRYPAAKSLRRRPVGFPVRSAVVGRRRRPVNYGGMSGL